MASTQRHPNPCNNKPTGHDPSVSGVNTEDVLRRFIRHRREITFVAFTIRICASGDHQDHTSECYRQPN